MRVVEVKAFGGPEVLRTVQRAEPPPDPALVRVRVEATTVNPVDLALRAGLMAPMLGDLAFPFVLGLDLAGTALDDRPPFRAGQRVVGYPWLEEMTGRGTNAEVVLCDPAWLAPLPDGVDAVTAATLPRPRVDAVYDAASVGQPLVAAVKDHGVFLSVLAPVPVDERPLRSVAQHATADSAQLSDLVQALAHDGLRSRVVDTMPLEHAADAHRRVERGGLRGKIVLTA